MREKVWPGGSAPSLGPEEPGFARPLEALSRSDEVKNKYKLARRRSLSPLRVLEVPSGASLKPVTLYNEDNLVYMKLKSVRLAAKHFRCNHKIINKYIASGKLFKR